MRYRPKQVVEILHISPATLRRWSDEFADLLSDSAAKRPTACGRPAQRRYTEADLAILKEASELIRDGVPFHQVRLRLLERAGEAADRRIAAGRVALLSREELLQRIASQEEVIEAQAAMLEDRERLIAALEDRARDADLERQALRRAHEQLSRSMDLVLASSSGTIDALRRNVAILERQVQLLEQALNKPVWRRLPGVR